jgi:hypothetical protein
MTKPSPKPKRRSVIETAITDYANLASDYVAVNRIKDARLTLQEAQKNHFDGLFLRSEVYALAFLAGDTAEMERQVTWALGRPGEEDQMLNMHADTQACYGRMAMARDLARQRRRFGCARGRQGNGGAMACLSSRPRG